MIVRALPRPLKPLAALVAALLLAALFLTFFNRDARDPALPPHRLSQEMRAGAYDPAHSAPDFSLRGSDGSDIALSRYRGKVVLLTFGFTHCAAVCPTTLATLAQARSLLGGKAGSVQVIFVTVDPDRDSAAEMRTYLAAFDPSFIGATGDPAVLAEVRKNYGVTAVKEGAGSDYAMAHSSSIFLIDGEGRLRAMMPFGHEAADFAHDVEILLKA